MITVNLTKIDQNLNDLILKSRDESKIISNVVVIIFKRTNWLQVGSKSVKLEKTANCQTLKSRLIRLEANKKIVAFEKQGTEFVWKIQLKDIPKKRKHSIIQQLSFF